MSASLTPLAHVWRPSAARRVVLDGFLPTPRGTALTVPAPLSWPAKDPADTLDYEIDVSQALAGNEGDGITAVTVVVLPAGELLPDVVAADGEVAVLWFSGGVAGTTYVVTASIVTTSGRAISRAVLLPVQLLATAASPTVATALTTQAGSVVTDQFGTPILVAQ